MVECELCGEPVDAQDRFTFHRMDGWERKGKAGGSDIVNRQPLERYAHAHCVYKERETGSAKQGALL